MFQRSITFKLIVSRIFSVLGNAAAAVVLPIVLLAETGKPLAAGTLALACGVPQFLAGILGGAALDRFNRRNISIISDLISAVCVAALPLVHMTAGLSLGWFIFFGILGAIGDIPGMTARSVLLPEAVEYDGLNLQRFVGISQAADSLAGILGPAFAAVLVGTMGGIRALWITSAVSLLGALVTLTVPQKIGCMAGKADARSGSIVAPIKEGLRIMFRTDKVILSSILLSAGILIITACYQNLIFPVYFTETKRPELLGYILSMLALGLLVGPILYSVFVSKLKKRTWYVVSIIGTAIGITIMGSLISYPVILFGAIFAGTCCGPFSALLGYLLIERVPEEKLGSVMGMQNAFLLITPPAAVFISSALVTALGYTVTSYILIGALWIFSAAALTTKHMRHLNEY